MVINLFPAEGNMRKKVKDAEDVQDLQDNRSKVSEDYRSKSFTVGGGKKLVNLMLPDVETINKEQYKKQPYCVICLRNFTTVFRQHHCRVCANAVCDDCSKSLINKQRACDLCVLRCSNMHEEKKKKEILTTLETLCAFLIYKKNLQLEEFEKLKDRSTDNRAQLAEQLQQQQNQIRQLEIENEQLRANRSELESELESIREANSEIESTICDIERELGQADFQSYT